MSQAEHPKLAEGFEACASSAHAVLPSGRVPGPLRPYSQPWLLTLQVITQCPGQGRKPWGAFQMRETSRAGWNGKALMGSQLLVALFLRPSKK